MARTPVLVDDVREIAREPVGRGKARRKDGDDAVRVRFAGGEIGRLNPEVPRDRVWAEVLESLRDTRAPAYVEIDPQTRYITSLLLPTAFTVGAVRPAPNDDGVEVDLVISQARHYVRRSNPRYDELRKALEQARKSRRRVLVTETLDGEDIVDVRPARSDRSRRLDRAATSPR